MSNKFDVRIEKDRFGKTDKDIVLEVTQNGYQWACITLSEDQALTMISDIIKYYVELNKEHES